MAELFEFDAIGAVRATEQARAGQDSPTQTIPTPRLAAHAEQVIQDRRIATHNVLHSNLLRQLRERMAAIYQQRLDLQGFDLAYVTADDARLILDSDPSIPGPDQLNRNFLGALFKAPGWRSTGQCIKSQTAGSHANRLLCWRWVGEVQ